MERYAEKKQEGGIERLKNRERQNKKVLKKNAVSYRQDMIDRTMFT